MGKNYFIIIVFLLIIPFQLGYLYLKDNNNGNIAGITIYNNEVLNSVSIGEYRFTLFGYTSPFAEVTFSGQGIADQTTADNQGFFEFENRFSPFSPHEACLSAKDQFGRISSPVCLPPFPTQYNVTIGPIIMPPTISLDKDVYFIGDQVILTGQTIPNTEINLSMFTQPSGNLLYKFQFPKSVEAFNLPKLYIKSDEKGNFSISLPSSDNQNFKLFTQTVFKNNQSPSSIFLKLKIEPIWMIILRFFLSFWLFLKLRLLETVIILEIIALLAYFFNIFFQPYYLIPKKRSIIPYEEKLPEILEKYPIKKVKKY